jgi:hypothetical protein
MKKSIKGRRIDTIFVLIVFGIFAFSVLMVLMLGAGIYRSMNEISQEGQNERLVLSYVRTKVKNYDGADRIHIGHFHGIPALTIDERIGDEVYQTLIYHYDGWLYELYSETPQFFAPEEGMKILEIDNLVYSEEQQGGFIRITTGDLYIILSPRGRLNEPVEMFFY